jgi:hypothetical protein
LLGSLVATIGLLGSLVAISLLRGDVGSGGRSLVGGLGAVDTEGSLGGIDIKAGLGAIGLSLSLGGVEVDGWALVGLLDLGTVVVSLGGGSLGLTSGEADLWALVGELWADLVDSGSLEGVAELGAVYTEAARLGLVVKGGAVDTKGSLGAIDTEGSLGSSNVVVNGGLLVGERSVRAVGFLGSFITAIATRLATISAKFLVDAGSVSINLGTIATVAALLGEATIARLATDGETLLAISTAGSALLGEDTIARLATQG